MKAILCYAALVLIGGSGAAADSIRPCGQFDISELSAHFQVVVSTNKSAQGLVEIQIATVPAGKDDLRQKLSLDKLTLTVRDPQGKTVLDAPLNPSPKRKGDETQSASLAIAPEHAGRVLLHRMGIEHVFDAPGYSVMISFKSVEKL